jgi:hypothetical protein
MWTLNAWTVRLVFASGIAATVIAYHQAESFTTPDWFVRAIHQSCDATLIVTIGLWLISEVALYHFRTISLRACLIAMAVASMSYAWLDLLPASFLGSEAIDRSTWHLISIFTIITMGFRLFIVGILSAVVVFAVRYLRGNAPP